MSTIIVKLQGGLGNQLFTFSAARRLAKVNNANILVDSIQGFKNDSKYKRVYLLDSLLKPPKTIDNNKLDHILLRLRRKGLKFVNAIVPFNSKNYICQRNMDFDPRILDFRFTGQIFFEGYWQSESYFSDIENILRSELLIRSPSDYLNSSFLNRISKENSVAVHVRNFSIENNFSTSERGFSYYKNAISLIESKVINPHYFIFSDSTVSPNIVNLFPIGRYSLLEHNFSVQNSIYDLLLMSKCSYFIITNSTFSWWGAWLSPFNNKIVVYPNIRILSGEGCWGFNGLMPLEWIGIK